MSDDIKVSYVVCDYALMGEKVEDDQMSSKCNRVSAGLLWGFVRTRKCQSRDTLFMTGLQLFLCVRTTECQPGDAFAPQVHIVFYGEDTVWSSFGMFSVCVGEEHVRHIFWRKRRRGSSISITVTVGRHPT